MSKAVLVAILLENIKYKQTTFYSSVNAGTKRTYLTRMLIPQAAETAVKMSSCPDSLNLLCLVLLRCNLRFTFCNQTNTIVHCGSLNFLNLGYKY